MVYISIDRTHKIRSYGYVEIISFYVEIISF